MVHDEIVSQPERVRFEAFLETWNALKATGSFVLSQDEANRIAALYNVTAPKVGDIFALVGGDSADFDEDDWSRIRGL